LRTDLVEIYGGIDLTIWQKTPPTEALDYAHDDTLMQHLGMEISEVGDDYIVASMPVDRRTHQPFGLLHGGASLALAETVGSIAANLAVKPGHYCLGLEINANHLRGVKSGMVYAKATPEHLGRSTQVWSIRIVNEKDQPVCVSRLTLAVLKNN